MSAIAEGAFASDPEGGIVVRTVDNPTPDDQGTLTRRFSALDLPHGVEMFEDWPERYVAVVADRLPHQAVAAIGDLGLSVRLLSPAAAVESAHELGPCALVMLAAEALTDESGRSLVHTIRSLSPYAPVTLLAKTGLAGDAALVQAMRAGATDVVDPASPAAVADLITSQLRIAGKHRERILAIGAHPDDIEIGAAGALLNHRRRGDRITFLTLSRGGVGGHTGTRSTESIAAARAIGAQLLMADLSDTRIDDGIDTIRLIESVVSALDPTIVYVHSRHDNHQDHRAVHTATLSATRGVPQLYGYQSPSATNDFTPTKFVPIDDVVVQKVDVLGLFDSQSERSYLEPELIVAGARYWARQLAPRSRYAEPFEVIRAAHHAVVGSQHQPDRPTAEAPIASVTRIPTSLPAGDSR